MTRWNEIKVHVAGVPLSSVVDCRHVVPFGCDVVDVVGGKAQGVLFPVDLASCDRTKRTRLVCTLAPRLRLWKRGSPLAPVVVLGEGQAS